MLLIDGMLSCENNHEVNFEHEVISTDSAFSAMSDMQGMSKAFAAYADTQVIELSEGNYPIQGLQALKEHYKAADNSRFSLTWKPLKCEVSSSGDLAYTFGDYYLHQALPNDADTVLYGNYVSIWKKQADGSWKFVLDGGNSTPGPTIMK